MSYIKLMDLLSAMMNSCKGFLIFLTQNKLETQRLPLILVYNNSGLSDDMSRGTLLENF